MATIRWHGAQLDILGYLASKVCEPTRLWLTTALVDGIISSAICLNCHTCTQD